jgi:HlyD family secretion protein
MKKIIITFIVLVIVGGAGVGAYLYKYGKAPDPEVSTLAITRGDVIQQVGGTGTIEAVITVDVGTQVNGIIKELYADFNKIVRKGELIAKIDPATIEATIERDKANLESAQANLERQQVALEDAKSKLRRGEDLFKRRLITDQDLETLQVNVKTNDAQIKAQDASIKQIMAQLNQDNVNLGYTNIYAPIDGIVINRKVDIGQTVVSNNAATSMFQIAADLAQMQVKANIDESDVGLIRPGQRTTFRVDAFPNKEFVGTVSQVRLQPVVQQNVVTYVTIINVPNPSFELKPGMTANVKIEIARREGVLRVPNSAIRFRPTEEIFAAFKQPVPPELLRGRGGRGGAGGARGQNAMMGGGQQAGATPATAQGGTQARGQAAAGRSVSPTTPGQQPADSRTALRGSEGAQGQGGQSGQGGGRGGQWTGRQGQGGGEGGQQMTDEQRRQRMQERLAQMTPEEREQFMARMKERGIDPNNPQFGRGPGGQAGGQGRPSGQPGQAAAAQRQGAQSAAFAQMTPLARAMAGGGGPSIADRGASTIDALFGPLPPTETRGRVWVYNATKDKKELKAINGLRLGISDGTFTELIEGPVTEGQAVVTAVDLGSAGTTQNRNTGSPLMPGRPMGGPGGFGGRGR